MKDRQRKAMFARLGRKMGKRHRKAIRKDIFGRLMDEEIMENLTPNYAVKFWDLRKRGIGKWDALERLSQEASSKR